MGRLLFTATHEQDPSGGECQTPTPTQGSKRKLVLRAARTPSPVTSPVTTCPPATLEIPSAAKDNNEQSNVHPLKSFEAPCGSQNNDPPPRLTKCQDEEPSISSNTTDPDWKTQVGKTHIGPNSMFESFKA